MEMRVIRIYVTFLGLALMISPTQSAGIDRTGALVPPQPVDRPVSPGMVRDLLYFERTHSLSVGDKGEDRFDVGVTPPACGVTALVFDHARIVYKQRRFGEAKVISKPPSGCILCSPLVVRWYHEPTGYLEYQVHVYRRRITGDCPPSIP